MIKIILYTSEDSITRLDLRVEAGRNSFYLSVKQWMPSIGARELNAKAGRYSGTFAHRDIAFEFGSWLSPEFNLYLIKEFQRLKEDENRHLSLVWNLNRTLSKINCRIHIDAIQTHLLPTEITPKQTARNCANEGWPTQRSRPLQSNRPRMARYQSREGWQYARPRPSLEHLLILANIKNMNTDFIHMFAPKQTSKYPQHHLHSPNADADGMISKAAEEQQIVSAKPSMYIPVRESKTNGGLESRHPFKVVFGRVGG